VELRNLLRGHTTQDALKAIEFEVAQWLDPVPVLICELAAQFILVTFARAYIISSMYEDQTHTLDPATVVYKHVRHAQAVYNKLNSLVFAATYSNGQPLCTEGERALFSKAREEGWVGECLGVVRKGRHRAFLGMQGGGGRRRVKLWSVNCITLRSEVSAFRIGTTAAHQHYS
jgi:hypothetical protein